MSTEFGDRVLYIWIMVVVTQIYPWDKMSQDYVPTKRVYAKIDEIRGRSVGWLIAWCQCGFPGVDHALWIRKLLGEAE